MCNVLKTFDPKILMQLLFNLIMIVSINVSKIYQFKKKNGKLSKIIRALDIKLDHGHLHLNLFLFCSRLDKFVKLDTSHRINFFVKFKFRTPIVNSLHL